MAAGAVRPVLTSLTETEAWALLARAHVGRLAFFNHGVVDLEPVNYVAEDSWLFIRSSRGTKIEVFEHHPFVAFEVDEITSDLEWQSVVVHGTVYLMSEHAIGVDRKVYDRAVRALRTYSPDALTTADPVPFRRQVYGIHVNSVTGRRAGPRPARPRSKTAARGKSRAK